MLNAETKRKIKNARDVLVGKIPVPTAQVEQITLALMFKFMGDMDEKAEKLGDKTGFFQGEYSKYSWKNVVDKTLSAEKRVNLYSEALEKMNNNPNVPQLFRDVFKGAFLPFRDPETLKLFLAEINEIEYTHSEDLGDAYEHLLSVMGSQGDAGQFRTPRHIIDFIVDVVDPKKEDRVLDPACGTAGFLISAYKHILKDNTTKDSEVLGDALSPMDRRNLTKNFVGYDISHEMRRLSLVNMYLHQFRDPQIYEYDTLASLDHWDEEFDCILANPPFMTPKGGIRPHNKFAVKANKAEVLFVDYIMSHLSTTGKAGVIVPEGIIFQSSNAYKKLRKLLVEDDYLWGVISLPQGVFNPYSGVKTSVLLLDKNIAKKTDKILFVNVDNDGFDLGAQRKEIEENDLPKILESLKKYKESVLEEKDIKEVGLFNTNSVGKSKVKESGDYNLSANRYQSSERGLYVKGKWEMVELGELCELYQPKTITSKDILEKGEYKVFGANGVIGYFDRYNHEDSEVLVTCRGATCGSINFSEPKSWITGNAMVVSPKQKNLNKRFLYYLLGGSDLTSVISGSAQPQITKTSLSKYKIPLPPIEEQKKIVEKLDRYQRIIDGAKMVIDNWELRFNYENEEKLPLGEILEFVSDTVDPREQKGKVQYIGLANIESDTGKLIGETEANFEEIKSYKKSFKQGDILYGKLRPNLNKVWLADRDGICSTDIVVIRSENKDLAKVYSQYFLTSKFNSEVLNGLSGAQLPRVSIDYLSDILVPDLRDSEIGEEIEEIELRRAEIKNLEELMEKSANKQKEVIANLYEGSDE
jgi:type I restriction enzyme M protein